MSYEQYYIIVDNYRSNPPVRTYAVGEEKKKKREKEIILDC
jgi:hypothetical protein